MLEIKNNKKEWGENVICALVHLAIILDIGNVGYHEYYNGMFYKVAFLIMLFWFAFKGVRTVVYEHRTNIKNQNLEIELENSHTALMLSQIKPHFIYNVLGTIREFCEEEPEKAAELVQKFSLYLRGNFTEMDNQTPILVSKEIEHVKHYVDIEMIRFPDMNTEYYIENDQFLVPALTIQPLVENAIKHGLMGLENAGVVKVFSREMDYYYEVCVQDDGVGFDESVFNDGKKHIGIANIRKRLETMCCGSLVIESVKGKGTTATIRVPKEGVEK
jgi:LytS/YehU family sensor histidine kinase